jgi:DNA ligase-1
MAAMKAWPPGWSSTCCPCGLPPEQVRQRLPLWARLDRASLMLCLKLITGSFRVGVSKLLVTRALAQLAGLDAKRVAQRLVGYTDISHRPTQPATRS